MKYCGKLAENSRRTRGELVTDRPNESLLRFGHEKEGKRHVAGEPACLVSLAKIPSAYWFAIRH